MSTFALSKKSLDRLSGVHPELVSVVKRAIEITAVDFGVSEGVRSLARQKQLVAAGASHTMHSRHLTGHAVDLAAYVAGGVRWDWPLYYKLAEAMKTAAAELGVPVVWGGTWGPLVGLELPITGAVLHERFPDGPHFQLPRGQYK